MAERTAIRRNEKDKFKLSVEMLGLLGHGFYYEVVRLV